MTLPPARNGTHMAETIRRRFVERLEALATRLFVEDHG
jgi:hypothetical protein